MPLWNQVIDVIRESIFAYSQMCHGNLGCGILVVTFLARLALLPLGIRVARSAQLHQRTMRRLQPELERIKAQHKADSRKIAEETQNLMRREGISLIPSGAWGGVVQVSFLLALYSAVRQAAALGGRFLWIRDLTKPDALLTKLVVTLTVLSMMTSTTPPSPSQVAMLLLSAVVTTVVLTKTASGIALYWGLSTLFGSVQGIAMHRAIRSSAA
jgi:YidC/Oxa1 family membrane protein insertase